MWTVNMTSLHILLQLTFFLISLVKAQELIASLDYGTFQGAYSQKYNITYFQKIPFAAPPVGENRFRAPQPPLTIMNGTYNSTQPFDMCPQRTVRPLLPFTTCII
jgi:Carboxylesterase family